MTLPIVVTHPSTLFHNGLRHLFAKSRFRPVRIATSLNEELEKYLELLESCVWLTGVEGCLSSTNILLQKVVTANPGVKAVILAASQKPEDIVAALRAGACGFLSQDLPGETLLRSLELIAHGEMIVHPQFAWNPAAAGDAVTNGESEKVSALVTTNGKPQLTQRFQPRSPLAVAAEAANENQTERCPVSVSPRDADLAHAHAGRVQQGHCPQLGHHRVHGEGAHEGHLAKAASAKSYASGDMGAQ